MKFSLFLDVPPSGRRTCEEIAPPFPDEYSGLTENDKKEICKCKRVRRPHLLLLVTLVFHSYCSLLLLSATLISPFYSCLPLLFLLITLVFHSYSSLLLLSLHLEKRLRIDFVGDLRFEPVSFWKFAARVFDTPFYQVSRLGFLTGFLPTMAVFDHFIGMSCVLCLFAVCYFEED